MSHHRRPGLAAIARRRFPLHRAFEAAAALAIAATVAGCWTPPAAPLVGADPSDPTSKTFAVRYRSTVAPYSSQRPVDPAPWREQNEHVTPPAKR